MKIRLVNSKCHTNFVKTVFSLLILQLQKAAFTLKMPMEEKYIAQW